MCIPSAVMIAMHLIGHAETFGICWDHGPLAPSFARRSLFAGGGGDDDGDCGGGEMMVMMTITVVTAAMSD